MAKHYKKYHFSVRGALVSPHALLRSVKMSAVRIEGV